MAAEVKSALHCGCRAAAAECFMGVIKPLEDDSSMATAYCTANGETSAEPCSGLLADYVVQCLAPMCARVPLRVWPPRFGPKPKALLN